jgi:hypothetical protein
MLLYIEPCFQCPRRALDRENGAASEALNITIFFTFQKFQILKFSLKQITFSIKHLHQGPRKKNPPLIGQKAGRIELRNHHGTEEKIKFE